MDVIFWQSKTIGRGCSRGFARTPLLGSKRFYIHHLTVYFKCPTVWKWSTSLTAIENHRLQNESGSGSSYASHLFSHGRPARDTCMSNLRRCDERTRINKLLFQALESSQVVLLVMSPHLLICQPHYLLVWKFQISWDSKFICGQPKIGCNAP